ncbi:MAG: hypothetical protein IPK04_08270 [Bdellovibrionales bacterium]|nr:hypothetical protein [Bdellovibrionales bacterium]
MIPGGRALGNWSLGTSHGTHSVRVEEYKRPTFEVHWKEQKSALRLNHSAEVIGEARTYFGAPLTSGRVRYTVARSMVFPWWCFWGHFEFQNLQSPQVIAAAEVKIENDGSFKIQFKPEVDGRESSLREIKYNYVINAEVLDDGGETRVAQKTIVLSHQAIEASLSLSSGFVLEDKPFEILLRRTLISGDPAPGLGAWKLVKLKEPPRVQMPAEDAVPHFLESVVAKGLRLPDDGKKARWSPNYNWRLLVRDWPEAAKITNDSIETDKKGRAAISLPKLTVGAYRLVYETKDSFGVTAEAQTEFFVANENYKPQLPGLFLISQTQAKVGELLICGFLLG